MTSTGSITVDRGGVWNARIALKRQRRAGARLLRRAVVTLAAKCGNATPLSDYEIALTGDRRTADVSNVVDIFGAHNSEISR